MSTGFIGFGSNDGETIPTKYQGIFKSLAKKDMTTKIKALNQLTSTINTDDKDLVVKIIPEWCKQYRNNLFYDNSWKVRGLTYSTFGALLSKVKKSFGNHLKKVVGLFLCGQFDPSNEVSSSSLEAFQIAIPEKNLEKALVMLFSDIFTQIEENLEENEQSLARGKNIDKKELIERYERVISSTLYCLKFLIDKLPPNHNEENATKYFNLIGKSLWKFQKSESVSIQKSFYSLCISLCKVKALMEKIIPKMSPVILGSFSVKEKDIQLSLLDSIVNLMKTYPDCWKHVDAKKQVIPHFYEWLKNTGYGSSEQSFQYILPFLVLIPESILSTLPGVSQKVLNAISEGYSKQKNASLVKKGEAQSIFTAWQECLLFFLKKSKNDQKEQSLLVEKLYFEKITKSLLSDDFVCPPSIVFQIYSLPLSKVVVDGSFEEVLKTFFSNFTLFIQKNSSLTNLSLFFSSLSNHFKENIPENSCFVSFVEDLKKQSVNILKSKDSKLDLELLMVLEESFPKINGYSFEEEGVQFLSQHFSISSQTESESNLFRLLTVNLTTQRWEKISQVLLSNSKNKIKDVSLLLTLSFIEKDNNINNDESLEVFVVKTVLEIKFNEENLEDLLKFSVVCAQVSHIFKPSTWKIIYNKLVDGLKQTSSKVLLMNLLENLFNGTQIDSNKTYDLLCLLTECFFVIKENENVAEISKNLWKKHSSSLLLSLKNYQNTLNQYKTYLFNFFKERLSEKENKVGEVFKEFTQVDKSFSTLETDQNNSFILNRNFWKQHLDISFPLSRLDFVSCGSSFDYLNTLSSENENPDKVYKFKRILRFLISIIEYLHEENQEQTFNLDWLLEYIFIYYFWSSSSSSSSSFSQTDSSIQHFVLSQNFQSVFLPENLPLERVQSILNSFLSNSQQSGSIQSLSLSSFLPLFLGTTKNNSKATTTIIEEHLIKLSEQKNISESFAFIVNNLPNQTLSFSFLEKLTTTLLKKFGEIHPNTTSFDTKTTSLLINSVNSLLRYLERNSELKLAANEIEKISENLQKNFLGSNNFKGIFENFENKDTLSFIYNIIQYFSITNRSFVEKVSEPVFQFSLLQCERVFEKVRPTNQAEIQLLSNSIDLLYSFEKSYEKGTSNLPTSFLSEWNNLRAKIIDYSVPISSWIERECKIKEWASCVELQNKLSFLFSLLPLSSFEKYEKEIKSFLDSKVFHLQRHSCISILKKLEEDNEKNYKEQDNDEDEDSDDENKKAKIKEEMKTDQPVKIDPQFQVWLDCFTQCSFSTKKQAVSSQQISFSNSLHSLFVWNLIIENLNPIVPKSKRYETIEAIKSIKESFETFLVNLFDFIETFSKQRDLLRTNILPKDIEQVCSLISSSNILSFSEPSQVYQYSCHLYYLTLRRLPVVIKTWVNSLTTKSLRLFVEKFTNLFVSPLIIEQEILSVVKYAKKKSNEDFELSASKLTSSVHCIYHKDDMQLAIEICVNPGYPLQSVELKCKKKLGLTESLFRKWKLAITSLLNSQDGTLIDAIQIWKTNLDKHFDGVEMCYICYSVFHPSNFSLPRLNCDVCNNKFHEACLMKWFETSHKSNCPLCQSFFKVF